MPAGRSKAPTDDGFNDPSRDSQNAERASQSPKEGGSSTHSAEGGEGWVPRPKRIACILCRKRKVNNGTVCFNGLVKLTWLDSS
jgi:hypothetical protein